MKNFKYLAAIGLGILSTLPIHAQVQTREGATPIAWSSLTRMGVVNMKRCLEESKLGKSERKNFEKMESQMESVLLEKQKDLEEIESKLNDEDYLDSISSEAEAELKRKKRRLLQEGNQLTAQYRQTLQQANYKIIQRLTENVAKASDQIASELQSSGQPIAVILNDEAVTYYNPQLDFSDRIIAKMDALFDAEQKEGSSK